MWERSLGERRFDMATAKNPSAPRPLFRVGDRVEFNWGPLDVVEGVIVEDRGLLAAGQRLYRLTFRIEPGEEMVTELSEAALGPAPPAKSAGNTKNQGRQ